MSVREDLEAVRHLPILVVDDEDVVRTTLRTVLESDGYTVVDVASAREALPLVDKTEFLMAITDVMMPGMSGLEFQRLVRARRPELPVVVVTGFPTVEGAVEALRDGAANFITKPFNIADVLASVERAAHARRLVARNVATQAFVTERVDMRIPSTLEHVMGAMYFMAERTLLADYYPAEVAFLIRLALDEALTNALKHGNKNDPQRTITIAARLEATRFDVEIEDEGEGFDPTRVASPFSEEGMADGMAENGRGLFLMRCHMDGLEYNPSGNRLHIWKTIPQRPA